VRERFGRYGTIALTLFALVKTFRLRAVAQCKVCRLDKGPTEVVIAILGIAFAFLFAVC